MKTYIVWNPPAGSREEVGDPDEAKQKIQQKYPRAVYGDWEVDPTDVAADQRMFVWPDEQTRNARKPAVVWILDLF
jgi:hypothetical protein